MALAWPPSRYTATTLLLSSFFVFFFSSPFSLSTYPWIFVYSIYFEQLPYFPLSYIIFSNLSNFSRVPILWTTAWLPLFKFLPFISLSITPISASSHSPPSVSRPPRLLLLLLSLCSRPLLNILPGSSAQPAPFPHLMAPLSSTLPHYAHYTSSVFSLWYIRSFFLTSTALASFLFILLFLLPLLSLLILSLCLRIFRGIKFRIILNIFMHSFCIVLSHSFVYTLMQLEFEIPHYSRNWKLYIGGRGENIYLRISRTSEPEQNINI